MQTASDIRTPIPNYKALLFDMDGTILQPIDDGLPEFKFRWGIPPDQFVIPNWHRLSAEAREAFHSLEDRVAHQSVLRLGALQLLEQSRASGVKVALVTNNARSSAQTVMAKHGLVFDAVRSRDEAPLKPAPQMLLSVLDQLGVSPQDALMVGDTRPDLEAARAAGLPRCLLLAEAWNLTLEAIETDFVCQRVDGFAQVFAQAFGDSSPRRF